ncbi:MAG: enoyl-CoA hydratase/isomerase family protein [Sphingobium sp.]|nr:enoyl-CoA hydratase/isomerase family protein [Sphingobium sp.]
MQARGKDPETSLAAEPGLPGGAGVVQPPAILVERDGGVARIILNRPERINAIDDSIRFGLPETLRGLDCDPEVRVAILCGNGPRGFCAGADIRETRPPETPVEAHARLGRAPWIDSLDQFTKPIIAAVHGVCMGGGFEMALACDFRLASLDALFSLPETGLGLIPGAGGTQRLPRLIGLGPALHLMLTGERIDAAEAKRLNLVTKVLDTRDELMAAADAIARTIAAKPPTASRFVKKAVRASTEMSLAQGLLLERDLFALLLTTEDRVEAANAFREKRAPRFTGS